MKPTSVPSQRLDAAVNTICVWMRSDSASAMTGVVVVAGVEANVVVVEAIRSEAGPATQAGAIVAADVQEAGDPHVIAHDPQAEIGHALRLRVGATGDLPLLKEDVGRLRLRGAVGPLLAEAGAPPLRAEVGAL